ncbi:MAG TPA: hypothetical protein VGX48_08405 [Pyrinomonadaceae bacterium]|nr:hypothetical protein [Pyrinomonadaceae bacterium]
MTLKGLIQLILIIWFVAVNAAILIPSYTLLFGPGDGPDSSAQAPAPPTPPAIGPLDPALSLDAQKQQVEAYKQQVAGFTEQVKSYTEQVSAYKVSTEARNKSKRVAVYETVVKGTLVGLIGSLTTALISYVFASLGAGVADNFVRMRNNAPPQPLTLL